jgi:hypothetical protein
MMRAWQMGFRFAWIVQCGFVACGIVVCELLLAAAVRAQTPAPLEMPPGELVRAAVANEIAANDARSEHSFRSRKQTPKGSQTKLYVETNDAMAAMTIAINDRPLTPEQEQGETHHLTWLMENPDQLRKKQAREKEDDERSIRIVKALPDAFRYQYDGTENSTPGVGKVGDPLVRLKFTPNPSYSPPTRVEQALEGMQGYVLIDAGSKRLAKIDGTLFKDVTFGWGFFGRLNKGGHFVVQQADAGDGTWQITEMKLDITGKILLFKSLRMVSDETFSDFHRVADNLTFAQGVNLLVAEREKLRHEPPAQTPKSESKGEPPAQRNPSPQ